MGDQSGYADNYCDAMDELASYFEKQGATIVGAWSTDGYDYTESKSVEGDKFVGAPAVAITHSSPRLRMERSS